MPGSLIEHHLLLTKQLDRRTGKIIAQHVRRVQHLRWRTAAASCLAVLHVLRRERLQQKHAAGFQRRQHASMHRPASARLEVHENSGNAVEDI
jgi:hypothetical protein